LDVTDVLRDRMHEPGGLQGMAAVSVLVHGAVLAAVIVAPGGWLSQQDAPPKTVMTISLGRSRPKRRRMRRNGPRQSGRRPRGRRT
jgi:hypothetical protein